MKPVTFVYDAWYTHRPLEELDEPMSRVGAAAGTFWSHLNPLGVVYIAYDTRKGSRHLAEVVASAVASMGLTVRLGDRPSPMPALNQAVREDPAAVGAIMLTADHRSADYYGLRLRNPNASAMSRYSTQKIEDIVSRVEPFRQGSFETVDLVTPYRERMDTIVSADLVGKAGLSVVCDPMYGALRGLGAEILEDEGLFVTEIHGEDRDDFGQLYPEVVEPWIDDCEWTTRKSPADLGFAMDGAGNRVMVVDANGRLIATPKFFALIMEHLVKDRGFRGRVVVPRNASSIIKRKAKSLGLEITRVAPGPSWAFEEIIQGDVLMAGDGLGGVCVPVFDTERNAMIPALLLTELIAIRKKSLRELVNEQDEALGTMYFGHRDLRLDPASIQVVRNLLPGFNPTDHMVETGMEKTPLAINHADGLRVEFDNDSWFMIRPSRSEALVRLYAEAPTREELAAYIDAAKAIVKSME